MMDKIDKTLLTECARCGTCCQKGGPAIHDDDIMDIDSGSIPLTSLYTIRKGELARDNVNAAGGLVCLPEEIVKIKSMADANTCINFDDAAKSCAIYDSRPVECRAMECWNTTTIEQLYSKGRTDRNSILKKVSWLLELVETHESKCDFDKIKIMVDKREAGDPQGTSELVEMINYDVHLRRLVIEKGKIPSEMLDFLFGRPLALIIQRQFGIKINRTSSD
jgi:Fe-S-cluster containining protein